MVATRRSDSQGAGQNVSTSNPPPSNPPSIEQALMTQTQLLQTIAQSVLNNPHQAPPIDKHSEFMKGHPPTFPHTSKPLEVDDWLRAVERQLDIAQCDDHEKDLFCIQPTLGHSTRLVGVLPVWTSQQYWTNNLKGV